jgi:hypothetical protein
MVPTARRSVIPRSADSRVLLEDDAGVSEEIGGARRCSDAARGYARAGRVPLMIS